MDDNEREHKSQLEQRGWVLEELEHRPNVWRATSDDGKRVIFLGSPSEIARQVYAKKKFRDRDTYPVVVPPRPKKGP